jgi:hypothetical protein
MKRLDDTTVGVPDHPGRSGGALQALARPRLPAASAGDGERPPHAPWNQKDGRGMSAAHKITARGYLITVAHYYLAVNAMTKPIQVREDSLPYGGRS